YNITPKLSIMLQPAIKYSVVNTRPMGIPQSYYKANNDGKVTLVDSIPAYIPIGGTTFDSFWVRTYSYSQTHDSIVKTNSFGGTYIEFELPVLVKYYVTKNFSVYGGPNMA